jgi:hypothetical protein
MSLKSFVTTLALLGSSTAALAQPAFTASAQGGVTVSAGYAYQGDFSNQRTNDWPWIRDHRQPVAQPMPPTPIVNTDDCANVRIGNKASAYTGPVGQVMPGGGWSALTQPTKIGRGAEQINVGADKGRFRSLELVSNGGDTYLSQVVIGFSNGQYMHVPVNRSLNQPLTINLGGYRGRAIDRIIVEGTSGFRARYSVLAV